MKRIRSVTVLGHKIKVEYTTWADGQWGECYNTAMFTVEVKAFGAWGEVDSSPNYSDLIGTVRLFVECYGEAFVRVKEDGKIIVEK